MKLHPAQVRYTRHRFAYLQTQMMICSILLCFLDGLDGLHQDLGRSLSRDLGVNYSCFWGKHG